MPSHFITRGGAHVITQEIVQNLVFQKQERKVFLTKSKQGPPGITGEPGPAGGSVLQRSAGETLSALLVVFELDAEVFALDKDDDAHIDQLLGLTVTAASIGGSLNVQRSGVVDDSGWSWTPGRVYLGSAGSLTQAPATAGNDVLIGRAVSATRIVLDLQDPIELE